jgi:hypothetical protein
MVRAAARWLARGDLPLALSAKEADVDERGLRAAALGSFSAHGAAARSTRLSDVAALKRAGRAWLGRGRPVSLRVPPYGLQHSAPSEDRPGRPSFATLASTANSTVLPQNNGRDEARDACASAERELAAHLGAKRRRVQTKACYSINLSFELRTRRGPLCPPRRTCEVRLVMSA